MKRGWCPSLHEPMRTGDGLLSRVKPPGGRLTSAAARRVAQAAVLHGNGVIELTGRGSRKPSATNSGSTSWRACSVVSASIARITGVVRSRRGRMIGTVIGRLLLPRLVKTPPMWSVHPSAPIQRQKSRHW